MKSDYEKLHDLFSDFVTCMTTCEQRSTAFRHNSSKLTDPKCKELAAKYGSQLRAAIENLGQEFIRVEDELLAILNQELGA